MIKVGVIGTGGISGVHLGGYSRNPNVEIYALCDINEKNLAKRAEEYKVSRTFTDYREMLALKELDAVSVCTWNSAHAECAIAALRAGKHVLCEKPMALNTAQAQEMEKAAKENGKLLMIGFVRRFGNDCAVLKDFIDSGSFGEIYYAKAQYLRRKGCPGGWFGDKSRSGGGPLIDLGVHVIDLCRYLMGGPQPVSVYGATFNKLGDRRHIKDARGYSSTVVSKDDIFDVEDMATALIRFDNGAVLSVEASFSLNIEKDVGNIELFGTKAGCKLDPELTIFTDMNDYLANVKLAQSTALSFDGLFDNEINHFVECIETGKPCRNPAQDGVTLMKKREAPFHAITRGGHITYVELDGEAQKNVKAIAKIVKVMHDEGIGYGSINHPVDTCQACGYKGVIYDKCPVCQSENIMRMRRITGYLTGDLSTWNSAKRAEERDRVKHG